MSDKKTDKEIERQLLSDYIEYDEVSALRSTDNYFICVGLSTNTLMGENNLCYHIVNKIHGVVESEVASLPAAIVHMKQLEVALEAADGLNTEDSVKLASVTDIKPTEH